jgi:pilus assembly protein Flp/PilA
MKAMLRIRDWMRVDVGASAVEYALVVAGIAAAVVAAVALFGPQLQDLWTGMF